MQPGYEELGYSKAEATVLVAKLVEEARIAAEEAGLKREREREREGEKKKRERERIMRYFTCFIARKAEDEAEALRVITIRQDDFLFTFIIFL